jgi:hypothetical protein
VALALCHFSDLLGERCHFGGLGKGFYTYREGPREGQRRLEASFGITMVENATCKLHDTCIAHVHDIAVNALGGAKMEMARCKVSGSTHGVGLSQTANVKAHASIFQGMGRGAFTPSECDNATLSIDGCTVQGRMWSDDKQAKRLTSQVETPLNCQFNPSLCLQRGNRNSLQKAVKVPPLDLQKCQSSRRLGEGDGFYLLEPDPNMLLSLRRGVSR